MIRDLITKLKANKDNKHLLSIYNESFAKATRKRDELDEYNEHREYFSGFFKRCPRTRKTFCVLDVGCGTGRYFHLLPWADQIVGLDLSVPMLNEARNPYLGERLKVRPVLIVGSAYNIPLLPASFDLVYSIGLLGQHLPFTAELCEKLLELVVPGGGLLLSSLRKESDKDKMRSPNYIPLTDDEFSDIISKVQAKKLHKEVISFDVASLKHVETFHTLYAIR